MNMNMATAKKLRIALMGATGNSGIQVIRQVLDRGHYVKALVRSPEQVVAQHENLKVVKVDIYDCQELANEFKDCDLVLSCLGIRGKMPKDTSFYMDTMKSITTAMRESGLKRVIAITSWGTYRDNRTAFVIEYGLRFIIARVLESMREMELYLEKECTDLEFTVVRPSGLTDDTQTDKPFDVVLDCPCVPQGWCGGKYRIARADVARFMIDCAETNSYPKNCVSIAV